jgi:hypothetical protein
MSPKVHRNFGWGKSQSSETGVLVFQVLRPSTLATLLFQMNSKRDRTL